MQDIQKEIQMIGGNALSIIGKSHEPVGIVDDKSMFVTEKALQALDTLPQSGELYKMQMEHLEAVTKMKFEMQELLDKMYLSKVEKQLEMRSREHEKEINHEEYMAEMRRRLREARLDKLLKNEGGIVMDKWDTTFYPNESLTIFVDVATSVNKKHKSLQLAYCFVMKN